MKIKKVLINNNSNNPILIGVYFKGNYNFCFTNGEYNLNTKGISHTKRILRELRKLAQKD